VKFQQYLQTLQFQRCGCVARYGVGGIACEILRKLAQRESYSAARAAPRAAPRVAADSAAARRAAGGLAR